MYFQLHRISTNPYKWKFSCLDLLFIDIVLENWMPSAVHFAVLGPAGVSGPDLGHIHNFSV